MAENTLILIVDDDSSDVLLARRALVEGGIEHPIRAVGSGEAALEYLNGTGPYADREKFPFPSLLLLDIRMPGKSGLDVLRLMRETGQLEKVTVVVLAGNRDLQQVREAYQLGAYSFLSKPLDPVEMGMLNQALRRARSA